MKRLRLKKNQQNHKVALSIKGRTQLWTKDLLIALFLALGLHLSFIFLFEIDLGSFSILSVNPTKISVIGDLLNEGPPILAESNEQRIIQSFSYAGLERQSEPELPSALIEFNPLSYIQETISHSSTDPWLAVEDKREKTLDSYFRFSHGFTGALEFTPLLKSQSSCKGKLEFQASTDTGQVIWIRWIASTGELKLDKEIENSLKNHQFKLNNEVLFAHGVLEIGFGK